MKRFKKGLSWLITLCMLLTMTPGVFAVEDVDVTETAPAETSVTAPGDDTDVSGVQAEKAEETEPEESETVSEEPVENKTVKAKAKKTAKQPAALAEEESEPAAQAITMGTKPNDGTTSDQPFAGGTGGSDNFRIPALVTLNDGTLVAATDARWNTTADNGGLDTIVSRSADNGDTWKYTFANYLGDNGNRYDNQSTTFIDPALAVAKDDTIYMLVDLFPGGRALSNACDGEPEAKNAFDDQGRLLLKKNGESSYDYYLENGKIYSKSGAVSDYTVDEKFNLVSNGSIVGNIFFRGAAYQVVPTTYLYLTKSTDKGATWSNPTLLNVKKSNEAFYGVGPGRGLVTSTGRIIFPCYKHPDEHTSFIYSDDNGATWTRTDSFSDYSSEATLTEADGKLYAFFRCSGTDYADIPYYVSSDNGATWTRGPKNTQIDPCTSCQMSAITYSKKIDGKTAILLSCPTGSSRSNGKIYVGLVNGENNTLNWKYSSDVISDFYAYSCLTELSDGSIGLLAETDGGNGEETYRNIQIADIVGGEQVTDEATGISVKAAGLTGVTASKATVEVLNGKNYIAYDVKPMQGETAYTGSAEVALPLGELANKNNLKAFVVENGAVKYIDGGTKSADGKFTFTSPHFSVVGVEARAETVDVNLYVGQSKTFTEIGSHTAAAGLNTEIAGAAFQSVQQYAPVKAEAITNGQYVISDGKGNYLKYNEADKAIENTTDPSQATLWTFSESG